MKYGDVLKPRPHTGWPIGDERELRAMVVTQDRILIVAAGRSPSYYNDRLDRIISDVHILHAWRHVDE